jgi:hypothetical protein
LQDRADPLTCHGTPSPVAIEQARLKCLLAQSPSREHIGAEYLASDDARLPGKAIDDRREHALEDGLASALKRVVVLALDDVARPVRRRGHLVARREKCNLSK